jgi:fused signal recognition particle receptor
MPIEQAIFLGALGLLFVFLIAYVFVIRPRRQRRLPPALREERLEPEELLEEARKAPRPRERLPEPAEVEEEPAPVPEAGPEEALPEAPEGRAARQVAERETALQKARSTIEEVERTRHEEADFRRREAEERKQRAEGERRAREERAMEVRRQEAERRRKAQEEARKRREEEERRRAEEEAKRRAEEEAKRQAEEVEARRQAEEEDRRRQRLRRLKEGLGKTRDEGFVGRLGTLLGKKAIDQEILGDLEEIMLTADIGMATAETLFQRVKEGLSRREIQDPAAVFRCLKSEALRILDLGLEPLDPDAFHPFVVMVIGVNGSGKTTTIGKMAAQYKARGKKVVLAAGDTFRAAATEQLQVWAERSGSALVRGQEGEDPSSVIFNSLQEAKTTGAHVVLADTAGRLQTKIPLMEELKKIRRVIAKACEGAPHEVLLVLDATNGQNAISQAKLFKEAVDVTGIVLTKLDGTAKGGVILGICGELRIPVRYIGIGESVEDLREFNPEDFVDALFEIREEAA